MKRVLVTTAIAGALAAAALAFAFMPQRPPFVAAGNVVVCTIVCEGQVHVAAFDLDNDGTGDVIDANASGSGTFTCTSSSPTPVMTSTLVPTTLSLTGTNALYGNFSFQFDGSRAVPNTTITANQAGSNFPATADVYANVIGTVANMHGTYINRAPCHLTATINTFNPQVNEHYTFAADVDFVDNSDPNGPTAFTIPAGSSVVMN